MPASLPAKQASPEPLIRKSDMVVGQLTDDHVDLLAHRHSAGTNATFYVFRRAMTRTAGVTAPSHFRRSARHTL